MAGVRRRRLARGWLLLQLSLTGGAGGAGTGCDAAADAERLEPPWPVGEFPAPSGPIAVLELEPEPSNALRGEWERAELGRLLFYDPILSSDRETACATCHAEIWGMGDGLAVSIGVGGGLLIGPGRAGPSVLTRNAPTLWNVAFRRSLFWDGRSASLEEQVLLPLASPLELDRDPIALMDEIAAIPEYATRFARAFPKATGDAVTLAHLQMAIAAFERTLVSDQSIYEAWLAGDRRALGPEVWTGRQVFADAGCPSCHTPPTFDSERFAARHVGAAGGDRGRAAISEAPEDEGAFKVPSLRNLRNTGPYFHDGSVADLGLAVDHELAESGAVVTGDERRALVAFLTQALVDRSRGPAIPTAVPSGLPVPVDGFRVLR